MAKTSEAMLKAINKYNKEKTDEIKLRVPKGYKIIIQQYCQDKGTSVNNLMNQLLYERLTADGYHLIVKDGKDSGVE